MDQTRRQDEHGMESGWVAAFGSGDPPPDVDRGDRPKLEDVAARAGVSLKQASRAINREPGVASATSERVLRAARELGFRPNQLAVSLARRGGSGLVGVLVPAIAEASIARMVGAIEQVLAPRDLALIVASHHDDAARQRGLATALVDRRVDALLLAPAPGAAGYLGAELARGLVVIGLGRPLDGLAAESVLGGVEAIPAERIGQIAAGLVLQRLGASKAPIRQVIVPGADVTAVME
jgi:LacI family transcriptional regulator